LLLKLLATASKIVRSRLEAENSRLKKEVHSVVSEVTRKMKGEVRAASVRADGATTAAASHSSAQADATKFGGMADGGKLEQIVRALAVKTGMPVGFVHRAVVSDRNEAMLLLAKAAEMKWKDVKALLLLKAGGAGLSQKDLELGLAQYERLKRDTAVQLLQFHRPASP
jgi:glutamate mutase epsilon subunit